MPVELLSTASYAAVIADLRAKRDEIDRAIATLEAMAPAMARQTAPAIEPPQPMAPPAAPPTARAAAPTNLVSGNTGIGEACARIVRQYAGQQLSTREVTDLVIRSGFKIDTANPVNNVWSALNQRAKKTKDIERVNSKWRYVGGAEKALSPDEAQLNGASHYSHDIESADAAA